jgi:hypothetical protein
MFDLLMNSSKISEVYSEEDIIRMKERERAWLS